MVRRSNVSVAEAKAKLSELLDRAAAGEDITITRSGKPLARLVPLAEREPRPFGVAKHWPEIPESVLLGPMDEDDLKWADGAYTDDYGVVKRELRPGRPNRSKTPRR